MLPPGTIAALKGHPNEIVAVAIFAPAAAAMAAGAPAWPLAFLAVAALGVFHIRQTASERHNEVMAQLRIEQTLATAQALRTRHGAGRLSPEQATLPLAGSTAGPVSGQRDGRGTAR